MKKEVFNKADPLKRDNDFTVAEVEADPQYSRNLGLVWIDNNWFTVDQARELRDWLNEVIP